MDRENVKMFKFSESWNRDAINGSLNDKSKEVVIPPNR